MVSSIFRIFTLIIGLILTVVLLGPLAGCGGHSETGKEGQTNNIQKPIVKFAKFEKPNVSATGLNTPGELKAFIQFDDGEKLEMALDDQKASAAIEGMTKGDHKLSILFEFHSPEYGEITIASAVKQIEIHSGVNNISITKEDYEIAAFDNDNDGVSNLDELSNDRATNPNVANNYPPYFTSSESVSLPENSLAVMQVVAKDPNGHLFTYGISGGSDAELFSIDAESGELSFLTAPNFEAPLDSDGNNNYLVELEVLDEFGARATQTLSVDITDSDTESETQHISFAERVPSNMIVGELFTLNVNRFGEGAISFRSSDKSVVSINDEGLITAVTPGSANIEVSVESDGEYLAASTQFAIEVIRDPKTLSVIRSIILDD